MSILCQIVVYRNHSEHWNTHSNLLVHEPLTDAWTIGKHMTMLFSSGKLWRIVNNISSFNNKHGIAQMSEILVNKIYLHLRNWNHSIWKSLQCLKVAGYQRRKQYDFPTDYSSVITQPNTIVESIGSFLSCFFVLFSWWLLYVCMCVLQDGLSHGAHEQTVHPPMTYFDPIMHHDLFQWYKRFTILFKLNCYMAFVKGLLLLLSHGIVHGWFVVRGTSAVGSMVDKI